MLDSTANNTDDNSNSNSCREIWQKVLGQLELEVSSANFSTWFSSRQTELISLNNGEAVIKTANIFVKEWLEGKFHKYIFNALTRTTGLNIKRIKYEVGSAVFRPQAVGRVLARTKSNNDQPQFDNKTNINPKYTFDNFIVGESNELARAACLAVSEDPGGEYNPLFIYGGVGLGKTHLVQATGNAILTAKTKAKIIYTTSENFTNDFIRSLQKKEIEVFNKKYREADVLIIDDIQFLGLKEKTQDQFFHTFNALYQSNKQIILTSDRLPKAIPGLEESLVSRFECGMIADIGAPDLELRIAILENLLQAKGLELDADSVGYIATNIQSNIRELEGAVNKLFAHYQLRRCQLLFDEVKKLLKDVISPPRRHTLNSKMIIETVSSFYEISRNDLLSNCRRKDIAFPRQVAMYFLREETNASFPAIGKQLGDRDHTTVIHAYKKILKDIEENNQVKSEIATIRQKLYISAKSYS